MGDSAFGNGGFSSSNFGVHNAGIHQISSSGSMLNSRMMGTMAGVNSMPNLYGGPGQGQLGLGQSTGSTSSLGGGLGMPLSGSSLSDGGFAGQQGVGPSGFQRPQQQQQQPPPPPHHHTHPHQPQQTGGPGHPQPQQQPSFSLGGTGGGGYQGSNELLAMLRGSMSSQQQSSLGHNQGSPDHMSFDLSEFPTLASGMTNLSLDDGLGNSQSNLFQGSFSNAAASNDPGFAIQNEDFPALPGSAVGNPLQESTGPNQQESRFQLGASSQQQQTQQAPPQQQQQQQQQQHSSIQRSASPGRLDSGSGSGSKQQQSQQGSGGSGSQPQQQLSSAAQYGLMGLLGVIRMTDPDLNTLALGSDLTTLGLNLNSSECLYSTFASPWADSPSHREPQFNLPMCYYIQPAIFKTAHFQKFQLETLFYIFYAMPQDALQAYAAQELYNQDWRYHSELRLWFKRATPADGIVTPPGLQYIYFDVNSWERRIFGGQIGNITAGLLSDEEVRVKFVVS